MVNVLVEQVHATLSQLQQKRYGLALREIAVFFKVGLEIAAGTKLKEEVNVVLSFWKINEFYDILMIDCFPCFYLIF